MTVIGELKKESLRLRKERSPVASSIVFAISEIEKVGKNAGNRETTEDEAIRIIQKIIATIDENLLHSTAWRASQLTYEKQILQSVLPQMATENDVVSFLEAKYTENTVPKKGEVMKALRDEFGARADMKRAAQIVNEMFGI